MEDSSNHQPSFSSHGNELHHLAFPPPTQSVPNTTATIPSPYNNTTTTSTSSTGMNSAVYHDPSIGTYPNNNNAGMAYPPMSSTGMSPYPPLSSSSTGMSPYPLSSSTGMSPYPPLNIMSGMSPYPPNTEIDRVSNDLPNNSQPNFQPIWTKPKVSDDDETVKEMRKKFEEAIAEQRRKNVDELNGIAILLIVTDSSGPHGTTIDKKKMSETFQELNFGVWVVTNPTSKKIAAVVHICTSHPYLTSTWCKAIVMYFAGHGGSRDGKSYVIPVKDESIKNNDDGENDKKTIEDKFYYIDEGIVYPLQPNQAPQLSDRYRLFFFDCCMSDNASSITTPPSITLPQTNTAPSFLPPRGLCLVAYATSMSYKSTGSFNRGGVWTRCLVDNIRTFDLPISTLLDMTYDDVAKETSREGKGDERNVQGPHYSSSLGLFFLKEPFKRRNPFEGFKISANTSHSVGASTNHISNIPSLLPNVSTPLIIEEERNIDNIMDLVPEPQDLKDALSILKDAPQNEWKQKFGKRLVSKKVSHNKDLSMTTSFDYLIDFVYDQKIPDWPTWRDVLKALEYTMDGKNKSDVKVRNEVVAQKMREYMSEDCVYMKYMEKILKK